MENQELHLIREKLKTISDDLIELREDLENVVSIADTIPGMAVTLSRRVLEYVVRDVYKRSFDEDPGTRPLENLLQRLVREKRFPARLDAYANTIRKLGNLGTHGFDEKVTPSDVQLSLTQLILILEWYVKVERPKALAEEVKPPIIEPPPKDDRDEGALREKARLEEEERQRQEIIRLAKEEEERKRAVEETARRKAEEETRLKLEAERLKRKADEQRQDKLKTPPTVKSDERVPIAIGIVCGIAGIVLMIWVFSSTSEPKPFSVWEYMKAKQSDSPIASLFGIIFIGFVFYAVGSVIALWVQNALKKNRKSR